MLKFTVINTNGEVIARHLTAAAAAHIILTDDGRDYQIRRDEQGCVLWTRQQVANRPWAETAIYSSARTTAAAELEIFWSVLRASWPHYPTAMADAYFDAIAAEA
jgi:hypothetical protein